MNIPTFHRNKETDGWIIRQIRRSSISCIWTIWSQLRKQLNSYLNKSNIHYRYRYFVFWFFTAQLLNSIQHKLLNLSISLKNGAFKSSIAVGLSSGFFPRQGRTISSNYRENTLVFHLAKSITFLSFSSLLIIIF